MDPKDFLQEHLDKPLTQDKKVAAGLLGIIPILCIFIIGITCIFIKPELASQVTSLSTLVVTAVAGISTAIITGVSTLQWRATSSMTEADNRDTEERIANINSNQNINDNKTLTENINEHVIEEGQPGAPEVRPFSQYPIDEE